MKVIIECNTDSTTVIRKIVDVIDKLRIGTTGEFNYELSIKGSLK